MTQSPCFPFIVGRGRSGTTLLRAMFDSHPEMAIPDESHFVVNMAVNRRRYEHAGAFFPERFLDDLLNHHGFRRWDLPAEAVVTSFRSAPPASFPEAIRRVFATYAQSQRKLRYGDKTPGYVMSIPLLAELFPESRFIHVIRDGRDVALSYLQGGWGPKTLAGNALYWKRFVRYGRKQGRRLGEARYREIRYEDLVDDPEREVPRLCDFLDLSFDDVMLRYFERADKLLVTLRDHETHAALRMPPTKGLRDWRKEMSGDQVALFEALAGDLLTELGYERATDGVPVGVRLHAVQEWVHVQARRVAHRLAKHSPRIVKRLDEARNTT